MNHQIKELLAHAGADTGGLTHIGSAPFSDCLPTLACRAASRLPDDSRTVIVFLFPYYTGGFAGRNVARYAVLPDYHKVAGGILDGVCAALAATFPGEAFVPFVDSSPIREVNAAVRAGLGVRGLHGLLINREYGSRVFIGTIVTTIKLEATPVSEVSCNGCGRCVSACPSGALAHGRTPDMALCRSHITQKKGILTPWEETQVRDGGLVWGCDICTDACPLNTDTLSPIEAFYASPLPVLTPENLDEAMATRSYAYRGRAVLERNLCIVNK